jgi:hypothetical protein
VVVVLDFGKEQKTDRKHVAYLAGVGVLDAGDQELELGAVILGRHRDKRFG